MTIRIRDASPADHPWVLQTNNEALPDVNMLSQRDLAELIGIAQDWSVP